MWFRALESWRGPAALSVAVFHFAGVYHPVGFGAFVRDSYLFVDFFFVLSGFVIATRYAGRLAEPGEALPFVIRRFGRLWPLHVVTLLAVLAWQLREGGEPNLALFTGIGLNPLLSNALLIHALGVNSDLSFNVPSWAASAELWACVLFALAMRFGGRRATLAAAVLLAASAGAIFLFAGDVYMDTTYALGFPRAVYGFLTGYFVFLINRRLGARAPGGTLAEAASLALAILFMLAAGHRTSPLSELAPLAFAPAVLIFAADRGRISALVGNAPLRFLGRISYSIYMVHFLVVIVKPSLLGRLFTATGIDYTDAAVKAAALAGDWVPLLTVTATYLALVVLLAAAAFYAIEEPGRRLANRIAAGLRGPRTAAVVP